MTGLTPSRPALLRSPPSRGRRLATAVVAGLAVIASVSAPLAAQRRATRVPPRPVAPRTPTPGSELTIYLMTMGVGAQIWEQFGHNAIWIHDARRTADVVYNWGLFDFRQPHFVPRFLEGQMLYSMGGFDLTSTIDEYRVRDRSVWVQELDLSPEERQQLKTYVEWNDTPGHREYFYDYFTDNCSTRVRDVLNRVLRGQLGEAAKKDSTNTTYRWHALRLTQSSLPMAAGIDIGLGRPTDVRLSMWEAMFLPMELRRFVRNLRVTDSTGATRPLVKSEQTMFASRTLREPVRPPNFTPSFLVTGLAVAGALVLLGRGAREGRSARLSAAVLMGVWSVVCGVLGVVLTLLWTVTDHRAAYPNENLLLFNPVWLILAIAGPASVVRGRGAVTARIAAYVVAALSVAALLAHVVGLSQQDNLALTALTLPPPLAICWLLLTRGTALSPDDAPRSALPVNEGGRRPA